jgi:hypothetical protein
MMTLNTDDDGAATVAFSDVLGLMLIAPLFVG